MEGDSIFEFLNETPSPVSKGGEGEPESPQPKENIIPNERVAFLLFPFFLEMIDQFKHTLKNLRDLTLAFQEKYSDGELGTYLNRKMTEDIKKIELVQDSLLNYIRINNPILRTNTVNNLIEEELKKYQVELEAKKIRLVKTLEKNLPETAVSDDQLRYMLSCVLQYVVALIPTYGNLGLFTKKLFLQREIAEGRERRFIEILVVCSGYEKPIEPFRAPSGIPAHPKGGISDLALRLVDEIVQRNHGMMKFEEDAKKAKTTISFRLPVERRRVIYYQQPSDFSSNGHKFGSTFEESSSL